MDDNEPLDAYRARLIQSLQSLPRSRQEESPTLLDVLVNEDVVGVVDCGKADSTLVFTSRDLPIRSVEIRTETGSLVGALRTPAPGIKTERISWSHHTIVVTVQNQLTEGFVRVAYQAAPILWRTVRRAIGFKSETPASPRGDSHSRRHPVWAFVLGALAVLVAGLVLERAVEWQNRPLGPEAIVRALEARMAATSHQTDEVLARLESRISRLAQEQQATVRAMEAQQEAVAKVQSSVDTLAQEALKRQAGGVPVRQDAPSRQRKKPHRTPDDVAHVAQLLLSQRDDERAEMEDALRSLSAANESLSQRLTSLEQKNHELMNRLKSAGVDVSKATRSSDSHPLVAEERRGSDSPPQVAQGRADAASPFIFWVSFQDGTPEERITDWFHELHGRPAKSAGGWYRVEMTQGPDKPAEAFLESLKDAKIVKTASLTHTDAPAQ